jgi:methylaspartate ammonia-lyase
VLFAVILCGVMAILTRIRFGSKKSLPMKLKIAMPEDMDYRDVFDDVIDEYTDSCRLVKVKTADYGSLFEITYDVALKDMASSKQFLDKIRCLNGNLNVSLFLQENKEAAVF